VVEIVLHWVARRLLPPGAPTYAGHKRVLIFDTSSFVYRIFSTLASCRFATLVGRASCPSFRTGETPVPPSGPPWDITIFRSTMHKLSPILRQLHLACP
jgi:hypothetical protein